MSLLNGSTNHSIKGAIAKTAIASSILLSSGRFRRF